MTEKDLQKKLTELLREFQVSAPGVLGTGIVSVEGFTIASELSEGVRESNVAAMAAAILALGEQAVSEFKQGGLVRVFVEGTEGYTIIMSTGKESVLCTVARKGAKLGLVFLQMERAAEGIRKAME